MLYKNMNIKYRSYLQVHILTNNVSEAHNANASPVASFFWDVLGDSVQTTFILIGENLIATW